ncbi:hypothetical protein PHISCL_09006 [Aspergillus sclerotialis]|uniref:Uncharacterized protein n=1 Tax=Aspergillus sclerotialis TaxID=2070753 RepID=A0A3A2Z720_9EURO|nr:hypothetical protein PHISCL_09006 [Aspergillus sclerotialis]
MIQRFGYQGFNHAIEDVARYSVLTLNSNQYSDQYPNLVNQTKNTSFSGNRGKVLEHPLIGLVQDTLFPKATQEQFAYWDDA